MGLHKRKHVHIRIHVHIRRYIATDHKRHIASRPINHHRILIVNGVAQSVVLADNAVALAAGGDHSMVLKKDGSVWTTGRNDFGQLGDGSANKNNFVKVISTCDMSL